MTAAQLLDQAAAVAERRDWVTAAHLLEDAPDTDEVLDRRGWYYSRAKSYNTAIEIFTVLRERRPHELCSLAHALRVWTTSPRPVSRHLPRAW